MVGSSNLYNLVSILGNDRHLLLEETAFGRRMEFSAGV